MRSTCTHWLVAMVVGREWAVVRGVGVRLQKGGGQADFFDARGSCSAILTIAIAMP